jgi:hypothetical protein
MILVTGDVVLDHNIYAGQRFTPDSNATPGMLHRTETGGATLSYGLLTAMEEAFRCGVDPSQADGQHPETEIVFGLEQKTAGALRDWPHDFKVGAVWVADEGAKKDGPHWKLSRNLGYGAKSGADYLALPAPGLAAARPQVLVIDDGALGFRHGKASNCWPPFLTSGDEAPELKWIILKM